MARRTKTKKGGWRGSFGVLWSPMRRRWFVLYSPKQDVETASLVGSYESLTEAERAAGFTSGDRPRSATSRDPRRRRRTPRRTGWDVDELRTEMEEGIVISEGRRGVLDISASGRPMRLHGLDASIAEDMKEALSHIRRWTKENNFYPNLFYVNDRGNVDLITSTGRIIESWV